MAATPTAQRKYNDKIRDNKIEFFNKLMDLMNIIDANSINIDDGDYIKMADIMKFIYNYSNEIKQTEFYTHLVRLSNNNNTYTHTYLTDEQKLISGKSIKCDRCMRIIRNRPSDIERHQQSNVCKLNIITIANSRDTYKNKKLNNIVTDAFIHSLNKLTTLKKNIYTTPSILTTEPYLKTYYEKYGFCNHIQIN